MLEKRFYSLHKVDNETKEALVKQISRILSGIDYLVFAYIHGSFTEGGSFRDIDVAVYLTGPVKELDLESDISFALTEKTGYPVEIRIINNATVAFQMEVLRKGRLLLSGDDEVRTGFIENVSSRYREYSHFRNILLSA
ncbi:MAG TPA: nucleotidyltransferase domain-containing protein [Nitrospinae bacterium]|nr:nucleotidyltransferase domain-containing protein [Nitrospinota bacterium]